MKNLKKQKNILPIILLVVLGLSSCKKNFTGEVEDNDFNREFSPTRLNASTVKDTAKITWKAPLYVLKGQKYTVDLSTDSLFAKVDYTTVSDTTGVKYIDPDIKLNTPYFVRVKANAFNGRGESVYVYLPKSFKLNGQQYLRVVRDFEITQTTVLIHWFVNTQTAGLTNIVFTPADGSAPVNAALTAGDVTAGLKLITGLTPATKYTVQLLAGQKSKGIINITTAAAVTYTTTLSTGANLATAIAAAANGDIIGLNPGTYTLSAVTQVLNKTITIRSTSSNPSDTKILLRELDLIGDGAGINLAGVEVNGNYSGTSFGVTAIVLYGTAAATGSPATFTNIKIDNCIMHDFTRDVIRANYATNANDHKIGTISINNSIIYNFDQVNTNGYYMLSLEKLQVNAVSITKSTVYNVGDGMVNMGTALSTTSGVVPAITFDYDTFNGFGGSTKYAFIDANTNACTFSFTNSIVANTPVNGTLNTVVFRASKGTGLTFSNNNYFKTNVTPGGNILSYAGLLQNNNLQIDLGWSATTTNFLLTQTAANTPVFSGSTNGSTLGDPRWAY